MNPFNTPEERAEARWDNTKRASMPLIQILALGGIVVVLRQYGLALCGQAWSAWHTLVLACATDPMCVCVTGFMYLGVMYKRLEATLNAIIENEEISRRGASL